MAVDLSGPLAKMDRAEEHINELYFEMHAFFESHADAEPIEYTFDGTHHVVKFVPLPEGFPLRLAVICGDAIHNMRVALDYLVWNLVLDEGEDPGRWTAFPVCKSARSFKDNAASTPARNGALHGIPVGGAGWTAIEEAQPYKRGDFHRNPFWILHQLDIRDKHRALLVQNSAILERELLDVLTWDEGAEPIEKCFREAAFSLEEEAEIARLRFPDERPNPNVNMQGPLSLTPTLGDGIFQVAAERLDVPYFHVRDFIEGFADIG